MKSMLPKLKYSYECWIEAARDVIFTLSTEQTILSLNSAFEIVTGFAREDWIGKRYDLIVHPEDVAKVNETFRTTLSGQKTPLVEYRFLTQSGEYRYGEFTDEPLVENGSIVGYLVIWRDVTERKSAEEQLRLAASVFENSLQGVVISDSTGTILRVNPAFCLLTGYQPHEVIGHKPRILRSQRHDKAFYDQMWNALVTQGYWQGEIWNRCKNGEIYPQWLSISGVRNQNDGVTHYIGVYSDITERKLFETRIQQLAHYDPLTELPNRRLFQDRLEHALAHATRNGLCSGLLYLDLDRFKPINDTLGHLAGDQLLQEVARRLRECVRKTDTVARLGGDEFTIILGEFADSHQALQGISQVAQKVIKEVSDPFMLEGQEVNVTCSIGAALFPQDGQMVSDLVRNADTAMYHAKAKGKNNLQFYSAMMNTKARERILMENRMHKALEKDEFCLHYQPQVDIQSGRIVGLEALLRWRDREGNIIVPGDFITLAEETSLIIPLGEWVLRTACQQLNVWRKAGNSELRMSVNISPRQFRYKALGKMVAAVLDDSNIAPECLELELAITSLKGRAQSSKTAVEVLKEVGVSVALDDFGGGCFSLADLRQIPLDTLKIDRTFVQGLPYAAYDNAIILAIIVLAQRLKLDVIAEGVESQSQLEILRHYQCRYMQGYLFSAPAPVEEMTRTLSQRNLLR